MILSNDLNLVAVVGPDKWEDKRLFPLSDSQNLTRHKDFKDLGFRSKSSIRARMIFQGKSARKQLSCVSFAFRLFSLQDKSREGKVR